VHSEIVRIDGAEQRVVGIAIAVPPRLEPVEPCLHARRRQLKVIGRHVAIRTRPAVCTQSFQLAIDKTRQPSRDGITGFTAAEVLG
jgi:hypothetical protein